MKKLRLWHNKGGSDRLALSRRGKTQHLYGLFLADGNADFIIDVNAVHSSQDTESRIIIRGIAKDRGNVKIHGNVLIKRGAKGTNTHFEAKALLLSAQARCEIIPALEIDENAVKASHSTYVGRLDEEELFYLQSRGIPEQDARRMLIISFLEPVLTQMSDRTRTSIKNRVAKFL